ncbi:DNA polymerase III subunit alpha [Mycoplasmopsis felis]|uniref:DNA polymerase III subunit alpha n=1 Tax=Mycoplasmopsis felis TaxID=33923 RepID=UPI002AFFBB92|nr:DNA polymerase III subunit alpha [Mycoplasmopsis felis]WQQ07509.1 DNA polymerase III subunit alpha [Mycoplasmopsis felis]
MREKIFLHTNTEYSFLNSTIKVQDLLNESKKRNQKYITLTDYQNFYALQYYWEFLDEYNFIPIIGVEVNLRENFRVILIAKNNNGLKFLFKLITNVSQKETPSFYDLENPDIYMIDHQELGSQIKGIELLKVPNNFYLNNKKKQHIKTVYAPVKRILNYEDNEILPLLKHISNPNQENIVYSEYFNDEEFSDLDEEVYQNMLNIVSNINISRPSSEIKLPKFSNNNKEILSKKILGKKFKELIKHYDEKIVLERIKKEIKVIDELGFMDYFLIIHDAIAYAKSNNINIGPGRGSASGSLVSYLLDITTINPLEFDLLFERFLNTERISMPDIDIDIQDTRRDEVFEYLKNKYGSSHFGLISTFQTLATKNSIRDVAKYLTDKNILNLSKPEVDKVCASISIKDLSLTYAYENNSKYRLIISKYPKLHELASKIEGFPRQVGIHAAGVVLCNSELNQLVPTHYSDNGYQQIQMTMNYLERYGLIKIDFLGLKNLTFIQGIENQLPSSRHFDYIMNDSYSLFNDQLTFNLLNQQYTDGIFQLESPQMRATIKQVNVDSFDDIYAIISLFRPGPAAYIKEYANNKKDPSQIIKIHPLYDEIVKPTFGIIVYQEQIMQIVQKVANMNFNQADTFRRAISKKDDKYLKIYKDTFFEGGLKNGLSYDKLQEIYSKIEKFANYGFNKSHAVAYALISYKMAYYKSRYPLIFYKSLLSDASADLDNIKRYSNEAYETNILVKAPEINISTNQAEISKKDIYLPLVMIKGIGTVAVSKIINERNNNGLFKNFISSCLRLRDVGIGESILEILIKAGTFRTFGNVVELLNVLPTINEFYNTYLLIKKRNSNSENHSIMNYIKDENIELIQIPELENNIELQEKYELQYLGGKYTTDNKEYLKKLKERGIPCLMNLNENLTWLKVDFIKANYGTKPNHTKVKLKDSSGSITANGWNTKIEQLINIEPKKIIVYIGKNKGFYVIKDFKEVINE